MRNDMQFYQLTESEIDKARARNNSFERQSDQHPSNLFQNINLDTREPYMHASTASEVLELTSKLIATYKLHHIFAVDIVSPENNLISRCLFVPKEKVDTGDPQIIHCTISDHIQFFMNTPNEKVKIYTLDGELEHLFQ